MKESKVVLEQFQMRNVRIKNVKYFGQINMGRYKKKRPYFRRNSKVIASNLDKWTMSRGWKESSCPDVL